METNKILDADVLDIIFDGRNKQYGAYELRKTYNRRLAKALGAMLGVCLFAIAGSVLAKDDGSRNRPQLLSQEISLANVREDRTPPPPVIPPKPKEIKIEVIKFMPPTIVKDPVTEIPPKQDDLDAVAISDFNQKGEKIDVVAPPVEPIGTGKVVAPKVDENFTGVFTTVQVQAQFPGGIDAWAKFLQHNLRQDVPVDNGAPAGDYKVVVSFLVDREGNITDVKAENDPGYGIAAEAIRVIQRSGKWIPALQNGNHVIYRQKQPITFQVADN